MPESKPEGPRSFKNSNSALVSTRFSQHRGDGGRAGSRRVATGESVRLLADGVLERGHGALRVGEAYRANQKKE